MPQNTLVILVVDREYDTVFVFFDAELSIFLIYIDSKHLIGHFGKVQ